MSDIIKVNACVYSRKGTQREINRDDFYMNGKFLSEHHLDNMEAAMENRGSEYVFAVADHMEFSDDEQRANFSVLREIGRFHEKITVHEGDVEFKTKELNTKISETAKYLESFLDMNKVPEDAPSRQLGFAGVLLTEGKAFCATYGTGHIYFCRGNVFKHMTMDRAKPKRLAELGIISDNEVEDFEEKYNVQDEQKTGLVSITEPIEILEGDKFLLISDGVYRALGEENIQDILSMRSDSTYIAYRVLSEAMKHDQQDDMTAMVVRIERVTSSSSGVIKKSVDKPKASALKSTPPPTYKYQRNKKNVKKYENVIYYTAVVLTAILLVTIVFFIVKNILFKLSGADDVTPTPSIVATLTPAPTPEITPEVTPEATPEPTQAPAQMKTHKVQPGETLTAIAKQYYGDNWAYVEKLGMYNNIPAPYNTIVVGQELKIPPKEELD